MYPPPRPSLGLLPRFFFATLLGCGAVQDPTTSETPGGGEEQASREPKSCVDDREVARAHGEHWGAECETCLCSDGEVTCTVYSCDNWGCRLDGMSYGSGTSFTSPLGELCTCRPGGDVECGGTAVCHGTNGVGYGEGAAVPALDCNSCLCSAGVIRCTQLSCVNACTLNGRAIANGSTVVAEDGCNTCNCANGVLNCTAQDCTGALRCHADEECAQGSYCRRLTGCTGPGLCEVRSGTCPALAAPTCGCDGKNYGNPCEAAAAGITAIPGGTCDSLSCEVEGVLYASGSTEIPGPTCDLCSCYAGTLYCEDRICEL